MNGIECPFCGCQIDNDGKGVPTSTTQLMFRAIWFRLFSILATALTNPERVFLTSKLSNSSLINLIIGCLSLFCHNAVPATKSFYCDLGGISTVGSLK
jgi:hypothetical protein